MPQVGRETGALDDPDSSPFLIWIALMVLHSACSLSVQAELRERRVGRLAGWGAAFHLSYPQAVQNRAHQKGQDEVMEMP